MEIRSNTTGLAEGLSTQSDVDGREHCVVAIVGTYHADPSGQLHLAPEQQPPTMRDVHHGDPARTSVAMEHDFALRKPATDVIVVGRAVAPNGELVTDLPVRLEVDGRVSDAAGDGYAFKEQALLLARLLREPKPSLPLLLPATCLGDMGVAAGLCGVVLATEAIACRQAPGPRTICFAGNTEGERAALVLTAPTNPRT